MKENKENISDIQQEVTSLEKCSFPLMYEHIREEFEMFSLENKMGHGKLLEYFGLKELQHHKLGKKNSYLAKRERELMTHSLFMLFVCFCCMQVCNFL